MNTVRKPNLAEPLRAVSEGDKQGKPACCLALSFGLMLTAGALSDSGVRPPWGTAILPTAGLVVLCSVVRRGGVA